MLTTKKPKKKVVPCEGCRERKKKCDGKSPCDRCSRLHKECIYLQPTLPPDRKYFEYLREQELTTEIMTLRNEMKDIELAMDEFQYIKKQQYKTKKLSIQQSKNENENDSNDNNHNNNNRKWNLTITKHGASIKIPTLNSYEDLLNQMKNWQQACQSVTLLSFQMNLPNTSLSSSTTDTILHRQLPLWLLRRGFFLAISSCVKSNNHKITNVLDNHHHSNHPFSTLSISSTSSTLSSTSSTSPISSASLSSPTISNNSMPPFDYEQQQQHQFTSLQIENKNEIFNEHSFNFNSALNSPIDYLFDQYFFDLDLLLQQILDNFFSCFLTDNLYLHKSTFYQLFVTSFRLNGQLSKSPVICAVCAAALTVRCRHVLNLIPYQLQAQLSEFLLQRAKSMISFDEPSLASFVTFTFLALYKKGICSLDEAKLYLDLAYRTRCIIILNDDNNEGLDTFELLDDFNDIDHPDDNEKNININSLGIQELIRRLHWTLYEINCHVEYLENRRGVPKNVSGSVPNSSKEKFQHHPIALIIRKNKKLYTRKALPDENTYIHRKIQYDQHFSGLMNAMGNYLRKIRFGADNDIPLNFLANIKYKFDSYYYNNIPKEYRMDTSLFEHDISDETFIQRLQDIYNHHHNDYDDKMVSIPMYATLQYFQGIISLFEHYLPDLHERQYTREAGLLDNDNDTPLLRSATIKINNNNSNNNSYNNNNNTMANDQPKNNNDSSFIAHQLHAQQQCTHAAIAIVRLLDYQRKLSNYCRVNIQILLTAWDIHLRNSCLGINIDHMENNSKIKDTSSKLYFNCLKLKDIQQARKCLLQCLSILREGYLFNFAEQELWKYFQHVEQLLHESLATSTNSVPYWTPLNI